jgi:CubicO group peptidase (beta-lactamase class C family)
VASALSYFELGDPRGALITLRQLLSHTSGLPDVRDYRWDDPEWDDGALERYVRSLATQKLRSDPGAFFAYSNMGYEVLGAVLAAAAESSFESFMETRVLRPLGMVSSTFEFPVDRHERLASPHIGRNPVRVSPTYPYNRTHSPSSTLHSSASDMCHWIKEHVRTGDSTGHRILDERTYDEMWSPQAEIRPGLSQGLGWAQAHSHLGRWISHGGRDIGFRASLTLLPDRRGGLALLSNHNSAPLGELRDELITLAFDESGRSHPGQP